MRAKKKFMLFENGIHDLEDELINVIRHIGYSGIRTHVEVKKISTEKLRKVLILVDCGIDNTGMLSTYRSIIFSIIFAYVALVFGPIFSNFQVHYITSLVVGFIYMVILIIYLSVSSRKTYLHQAELKALKQAINEIIEGETKK
jgi:hypothetical protein